MRAACNLKLLLLLLLVEGTEEALVGQRLDGGVGFPWSGAAVGHAMQHLQKHRQVRITILLNSTYTVAAAKTINGLMAMAWQRMSVPPGRPSAAWRPRG